MIKALKWMLLFLGLRELKKDQPLRVRWGSSVDRKDMALSSQIMRRTPSLFTSQSMYLYYDKNFIYKWDQYLSGEKKLQGIYVCSFSKDCLALTSFSLFLGFGKEMQNNWFHGFGINSLNVYMLWIFEKWTG